MIRVTSGTAKNKRLVVPAIPNIRAVQEVVKQSMFSIIGEKVIDAVCLDLFAGSGNLGIEALSRGASWCDFVDENPLSKDAVNHNLVECGFAEKGQFYLKQAAKFSKMPKRTYDLVFVDPFYDDLAQKFLISNLENLLNDGGVIAFTHGSNLDIENMVRETGLKTETQRRFGASHLTILNKI